MCLSNDTKFKYQVDTILPNVRRQQSRDQKITVRKFDRAGLAHLLRFTLCTVIIIIIIVFGMGKSVVAVN